MRKLKVVAFTAHPDDMEVLMAGTLLKYKEQGHDVQLVIATDGRRGRGKLADDISWQEIVKIRREEAIKAAEPLGIVPIFLDIEDHRLIDDRDCYEKVIAAMESINPDVIFTCAPNDYHNDHRVISHLVLNCAWAPVFFAETAGGVDFIPDFYVDITNQFETKIKMLYQHDSQFKENPREMVEIINRFRGMQCMKAEIRYAEGFKLFKRIDWVKAYELLPKDEFSLPEKIVPTTERN